MTQSDLPQKRKITIRDVAKRAGVGIGTVSRVLNNHASVAAETRAAIREVMAELDFQPDAIARDLNRKFTRCLGVVVPDLTNPFFAELVQALETVARASNYNLFLASSSEDRELEAASVTSLSRRRIDGLFLIPAHDGALPAIPSGLPVIHVDRLPPGRSGVAADHAGGIELAVNHLLALGHRRIALLSGEESSLPARQRRESFIRLMAARLEAQGIALPDYIRAGHFDLASGEQGLHRLMSLPEPQRPTAVVASSDQQAIGALHAAHTLGLSVPRDLSLIGFDGLAVVDMIHPRLTTIAQPVRDIARNAFLAFEQMRDGKDTHQQILLECHLRHGETTAACPAS